MCDAAAFCWSNTRCPTYYRGTTASARRVCACMYTALPAVIRRRSFARGFSSGHLSTAVPLTPVARHHRAAIYAHVYRVVCVLLTLSLSLSTSSLPQSSFVTASTCQYMPRRRLVCVCAHRNKNTRLPPPPALRGQFYEII